MKLKITIDNYKPVAGKPIITDHAGQVLPEKNFSSIENQEKLMFQILLPVFILLN